MEKRDNEIFMQSPAPGNHQRQSNLKVRFHAVGQEKKCGALAESKNPYSNQKRGPTFRVVDKTQILCFA